MSDSLLSRRQILLSSASLALTALPAAALLQPASKRSFNVTPPPPRPPAPAGASPLDALLKPGRTRSRTLHVALTVLGRQPDSATGANIDAYATSSLVFQTAVVVFPILPTTAGSSTDLASIKGVLKFDTIPQDVTPEISTNLYACGTRLAKWELSDKVGHQVSLDLDLPITSWETLFDEPAARAIPWPTAPGAAAGAANAPLTWSKVAMSSFDPQLGVDRTDPALVAAALQLTNNKPATSIPPVELAKYFAGKVAEMIQLNGDGYVPSHSGYFAGLQLKGAAQTWADKQGTEHDMACLLAALYRNAGLPARTVIGHDISETKGQRATPFDRNKHGNSPSIRSWVEFCLYDPASDKELWVPVDPVRIRKFSSRMQPMDKPWKYFGTHDELDDVLPFAFQYLPPTTVDAPGAYQFWGWSTVPAMQDAVQGMHFTTNTTPKSGDPTKTNMP